MQKMVLLMTMLLLLCSTNIWADDSSSLDEDYEKNELVTVFDPIEPVNRLFFGFNALFYKVLLEPVSKVYNVVLPEEARKAVDNVWLNLKAPVRIVNNVLQGDMNGAGREVARFLINSTIGIAGLTDPAKTKFDIEKSDEDFGQTLAYWGISNGIYLVLPMLGPTTIRDSIGLAGDIFLTAQVYCPYVDSKTTLVLYGGGASNHMSLNDSYTEITKNSMAPYVAVRDAYIQYRNCKIKK